MNTDTLNNAIDWIIQQPHYKREGGSLTKEQIQSTMFSAWKQGLLNFVSDIEQKKVIGCFECHIVKKNKLWILISKFPKLVGVDEDVMFIDMAGKIDPDYPFSFTDMMKIAYKCGEIGGAKVLYYRNWHHHYLYRLTRRSYKSNEIGRASCRERV